MVPLDCETEVSWPAPAGRLSRRQERQREHRHVDPVDLDARPAGGLHVAADGEDGRPQRVLRSSEVHRRRRARRRRTTDAAETAASSGSRPDSRAPASSAGLHATSASRGGGTAGRRRRRMPQTGGERRPATTGDQDVGDGVRRNLCERITRPESSGRLIVPLLPSTSNCRPRKREQPGERDHEAGHAELVKSKP